MARSRHDLSHGWQFRETPGPSSSENPWLPVQVVPTQVHMDLLANKKIPDPFLNLNELEVRSLAEKQWAYRTQFSKPLGPASELSATTDLVFEGLDTFATVWLNGTEVLKSDNMFISHRVDVKNLLKDMNELEIKFDSAMLRGRELVEEHSHEHTFYVRQTEVSRVPVRKAQYHWGWDWGPILITAGPWKPVYLEQYVARIEDFWTEYEVSEDLQTCSGRIIAKVSEATGQSIQVSLSLNESIVFEKDCTVSSSGIAEASFSLAQPELWYPFTHGAQTRYELKASPGSYNTRSKRIGFRRAQLIQQEDEFGKSFFFRINGNDVFCGGSCWIPADSFVSQIPEQRYRDWVKLLYEGNQNMIRVWGGGIYEDDIFYDACDELGIMVWQDFAFACASYPTYKSFLDSVETEARQNIRRLRWHPSLIIWAGSNEDYQVQERYKLEYNYEDKDPQSWLKSTFPARYTYEYLLPKILSEEDRFAIYHPTSPWGDGKITSDPTVGDKHQWDIWHGAMNRYQEVFRLSARFISEFGMEAYPHLETIRSMITVEQQRYPGSMMMDFRNKAIDHERRVAAYVNENFTVKYDLASYTHLTQVVQAEAMHFAYKAWRREWGQRKCGGILVWQLNDCWPTMSWAVVDYYLVKKPAYYAIKNALKPISIGLSREYHDWTSGHVDPTESFKDSKFDLWIVSDRTQTLQANIAVRFISIKTGQDIRQPVRLNGVTVIPNSTTEVLKNHDITESSMEKQDKLRSFNISEFDPYVIYATLTIDDHTIDSDTYWPQPLKYLDFSDRNITVRALGDDKVTISAGRPTKGFVIEEMQDVGLSDNGFDIVPGQEKVIEVVGPDIWSLRYTYIGAPGASMPLMA
ncbi:family 2 glycosyl hydrolase [Xylaria bambusicola]|uniref:family 2 glycosyl hydrolase n=1 Tax=Xylaria bambusicola TaxID=326684 RepID=UPI002007CF00|nr:family 2 glycosyl hydrolase [Xylaria bambusicola]KAI0512873.1 family 2 glycosyl hydrolase [Xylaria bambusicola]